MRETIPARHSCDALPLHRVALPLPRLVLLALPLLLSGCPGPTLLGGARTLPPGELQVAIAPGAATATRVEHPMPQLEAAARYGLTEGFDLGVRTYVYGGGVEGRLQLLRASSPEAGLDLSLAPAIGGGRGPMVLANLPVIAGLNFTDFQLLLAPGVALAADPSGGAWGVLAGGSGGLLVRLADETRELRSFSLLLQGGALRLVQGSAPAELTLLSAGVALVVGG